MDERKILARLQAVQMKALTAAAYVLLAHVLPFVPIDTGSLRASGKVKPVDNGIGLAFGGDSITEKYAAFQYYKAENHYFKSGAMARLLELLHGEERADVSGEIGKDRYAAAYRQAMDEGRLTKFPNGARWFEIIMKDREVLQRAWAAYANALRAA